MEKRISKILMAAGIHPNMIGFHYLRSAILLVYNQPSMAVCTPKRWNTLIAKEYNVAAHSVERPMRYVINLAWDRVAFSEIGQYFPVERAEGKTPTVNAFVATVAEHLRVQES